MSDRIIGRYTHGRKGPLVIVLAAIHGNEPAGVKALDYLFKMLEVEPITNPNFSFSGEIVGCIGNHKAYQLKKRFIDIDLNRIWQDNNSNSLLHHEYHEQKEIIDTISREISKGKYSQIILLDLHTTSSDGGIFVIPGQGQKSLDIAKGLHAPVILNMLHDIKGTIMDYYNEDRQGLPIHSLTFESGSHQDPLSVNRAIAAIINCMRYLSMVDHSDVESIHDDILQQYAKGLPKVSRLIYRHPIAINDDFRMNLGYHNFQMVEKNEKLAKHNGEEIISPHTARILMPLYQKQGSEGFYIIEDIQS